VLKKFLKQFKDKPAPLLIHTADSYLLKDLKKETQSILIENKNIDFNFDYFDDESFELENVFNSFYKTPFLSKKRVVLINNIQKIDYRKLSALLPLTKKVKKTFLILVSNENLDKKTLSKVFFKSFSSSNILALKLPTKANLEKFILSYLKKENKIISENALFTLLENLDENYLQTENELIKLVNGVERENIDLDDILNISYAQNSYSVFDLLDFILINDLSSALEILKKYFENIPQGELIKFYGLLHMQFQKLLLFYYFRAKGYGFADAAKFASLNYFDQKRIKSQKGNISFNKLLQKYEILLEYEPMIKFGGQISFYQMENMIIKIIEV